MATIQNKGYSIIDDVDLIKPGQFRYGEMILCNEDHGIYLQLIDSIERYGGFDVRDNLDSTENENPLSANMGRILNYKINKFESKWFNSISLLDLNIKSLESNINTIQTEINEKIDTIQEEIDVGDEYTSNLDVNINSFESKWFNSINLLDLNIHSLESNVNTIQDEIDDSNEYISNLNLRLNNLITLTDIEFQSNKKDIKELATFTNNSIETIQSTVSTVSDTLEDTTKNISELGNTLYPNGYILEGCLVSYNASKKLAQCDSGKVVFNGLVYDVSQKNITIRETDPVQIGILKYKSGNSTLVQWYSKLASVNTGEDEFLLLYGITSNTMENFVSQAIPDYMPSIQKYDYHANGSYVAEGLTVTSLSGTSGKHTYNISQGSAHINGILASITHSEKLIVDEEADLGQISYEYHRYAPGTYASDYEYTKSGNFTFTIYQYPIEDIIEIHKMKLMSQETQTFSIAIPQNTLANTTSSSSDDVIKVWSGSTTYIKGTDYNVNGNTIVWNTSANTPTDGSTFYVKYLYSYTLTTSELAAIKNSMSNKQTITVPTVLENTTIIINYTYRMPRYDLIVMYQNGSFGRVKGVPHRYNPQIPDTPPNSISLARAYQDWYNEPSVTSEAVQVIKMEKLNTMNQHITNLYGLVAKNELRFEALANSPAATYGVFVDPLDDDSMRDMGIAQTAIISDNVLQLPMEIGSIGLYTGREYTLDSSSSVINGTVQEFHPSSIQINPYQAYEKLPILVTLSPAIDRNVETIVKTLNTALVDTHWWETVPESRYTYRQYLRTDSTTTVEDLGGNIRQIQVTASGSEFGPNEDITIYFDGIDCSSTQVTKKADENGVFSSEFTIPSGVPVGTKLVTLSGSGGSVGYAYFVGINERRTTINIKVYRYRDDPLAQTFTLSETRMVSALEFFLTKKGTTKIKVQIKETNNGFPTNVILAEKELFVNDLIANAWNKATFDTPVLLSANVEYCFVLMCDSADHEVGIANLGDWVDGKGWITSQPYQIGVMLSSSNASTWTAHQNTDLAFRLYGLTFSSTTKIIELGTTSQDFTGITDLVPLMEVQNTSANTDAQIIILDKNDNQIATCSAWQNVQLNQALSGTGYKFRLVLKGDNKFSPIVGRDPQIMIGKLQPYGSYYSRSFSCGSNKKVMITINEYKPTGSSISVGVLTSGTTTYTNCTTNSSEDIALGNDWYTRKYYCNCSLEKTKIRILLSGNAAARPYVTSISAVILDQ